MGAEASDRFDQRFLVDLMLMRLGRWLRLMGQDVANPEGGSDGELMNQAGREYRTVVTRDQRLCEYCRRSGQPCLLIRSSRIEGQLLEMAEAGVALRLDPRRCTLCNGLLKETEGGGKEQWQCQKCGKIYWHGSHWRGMEKMLAELYFKK